MIRLKRKAKTYFRKMRNVFTCGVKVNDQRLELFRSECQQCCVRVNDLIDSAIAFSSFEGETIHRMFLREWNELCKKSEKAREFFTNIDNRFSEEFQDLKEQEDQQRIELMARQLASSMVEKSVLLARKEWERKLAGYPEVPEPSVLVSEMGEGIPDRPGVYFVWDKSSVVYVGQSVCLKNRVNLHHERICFTDTISYLLFPIEMLNFAEAFYIGVCRPGRNNGPVRSIRRGEGE